MPHTDSDFLTILYQDQVGGLQLIKDNRWIAVKPNPRALIINIGDLFQVFKHGEEFLITFSQVQVRTVRFRRYGSLIESGFLMYIALMSLWIHPHPSLRQCIKMFLRFYICVFCQAWSNGMYKSVEHRVMTNPTVERFSTAYFLCPSYDAVIECSGDCPAYRNFSFGEFRQQVQEDVKKLGYKVGLPRFINDIY